MQLGIRCLQCLDLGLDLPLEIPSPFGELGLAEDFEAIPPIDQVARDSAQLRLSLACCCDLSRWQSRSSLVGLLLLLLGVLWRHSRGWQCVLFGLA